MTETRFRRLRRSIDSVLDRARPPTDDEPRPKAPYWLNVAIHFLGGACVVFLLHVGPQSAWLAGQQEKAIDWMVRMYSGVSPSDYRGAPFVFLEIDESSYRAWDEPLLTPRDKLRRILSYAIEGEAAVVLVDIDLSRRSGPDDEALQALLRSTADEPGGTQVVLARTFREPFPRDSRPWREERLSFLDPTVAAAPDVHWASTLFLRESDQRIRRFRNAEPTCNEQEANVVPAMQLLATALLLDPANGAARLAGALAGHMPDCSVDEKPPPPPDESLDFDGLQIALFGNTTSSRILYNFGSEVGAVAATVPFEGRQARVLTRIPAFRLTETEQRPDPELVRGRVVVIGASFVDSRDNHLTPLGEMPGALILANAIYSLTQHGGLKPPSTSTIVLVQLGLVFLGSLSFAGLSGWWATTLTNPMVIVVLVPAAFWLFRYGVWLDFALPLVALQILSIIKKYRERYMKLRTDLASYRERRSQP